MGKTYTPPSVPENEAERLEEMRSLQVLDAATGRRLDRYTSLIADLFGFPIVYVSLIDRDRLWFKSSCGLEHKEWPREISFCGHAILEDGVFVVADARRDPRFSGNPSVEGEPYIRFYAGVAVRGPAGQPVGTLCVIDHKVRRFKERECERLKQFAALVEGEFRHDHELSKLRSSLEFNTFYDPLTRLPNKSLFCDRLKTMIEERDREDGHLAVVVFNLGGLRYVNQAHGASAGDQLLRQVGERIQSRCPRGGEIARLGGDEFVMVFPLERPDMEACDAVLRPVHEALDQPYRIGQSEHFADFRVGVSFCPHHGTDPVALLDKAAAAIRARDSRGVTMPRRYEHKDALKVSERLHMESRLKRGLKDNNFRLEYQPIIDLQSERLFAVEALLRWDDDEVEDTSPARFIPVAEDSGLITQIGDWTVREAVRQLAEWQRQDAEWSVSLTLNVSASQLQQAGFSRLILEQLSSYEVRPELLMVEVTEYSLILDVQRVREHLETLSRAGVRALIDDFGTGYCSLQYLRRMPVWAVKIDRGFVKGVPEDEHDVAIIRTILAMAHSLELRTVAEGIEHAEQLQILRDLGCDYAQGFLLAYPSPAAEIPGWRMP